MQTGLCLTGCVKGKYGLNPVSKIAGYKGTKCDQPICEDATKYGANCDKDCPGSCLDKQCDKNTGDCLLCMDARYGLTNAVACA